MRFIFSNLIVLNSIFAIVNAANVLNYKSRASYYLSQIIPPGTPWPASPEDYAGNSKKPVVNLENRFQQEPSVVLTYKPITSFYHPQPVTPPQIIPPGKPWPASLEGYTSSKPSSVDLEQRFPEAVQTTETIVAPSVVLTYKPITSFYHPYPVTPPQIIPPGRPWPASAEGYADSKSNAPATSGAQEIPLNESSLDETSKKLTDLLSNSNGSRDVETVLEYKPTRPFFVPEPATMAQIISSGTPWPASPEAKPEGPSSKQPDRPSSSSKVTSTDRFSGAVTEVMTSKKPAEALTILEYKPTRPPYVPEPVTVAQIIPPGKPWPDSSEGHASAESEEASSERPSDAITDEQPRSSSSKVTSTGRPSESATDESPEKPEEALTILEYKPTRPSYVPEPVTVAQIIPPGKPWPASPEEYSTTSWHRKTTRKHRAAVSPLFTSPVPQRRSPKTTEKAPHPSLLLPFDFDDEVNLA